MCYCSFLTFWFWFWHLISHLLMLRITEYNFSTNLVLHMEFFMKLAPVAVRVMETSIYLTPYCRGARHMDVVHNTIYRSCRISVWFSVTHRSLKEVIEMVQFSYDNNNGEWPASWPRGYDARSATGRSEVQTLTGTIQKCLKLVVLVVAGQAFNNKVDAGDG